MNSAFSTPKIKQECLTSLSSKSGFNTMELLQLSGHDGEEKNKISDTPAKEGETGIRNRRAKNIDTLLLSKAASHKCKWQMLDATRHTKLFLSEPNRQIYPVEKQKDM